MLTNGVQRHDAPQRIGAFGSGAVHRSDVVDRLMGCSRPDPILILCKAAGWGWPTVRAVMLSRPHVKSSSTALDNAFSNFERLSPTTGQGVMKFWQARTPAAPEIR